MILPKIKKFISKDNVKRIVIFVTTFIMLYIVLMTSMITKKYNLQEGDIAKVDIEAPREVKDRVSTDLRLSEALNSVGLQFSKKTDVKDKVISEVNETFNSINKIKDNNALDEKTKINNIKGTLKINFTDDNCAVLLVLTKDELKVVQDYCIRLVGDLYDNNNIEEENIVNVNESKESYKKAKDVITLAVNNFETSSKNAKGMKDIVSVICFAEIKPNFFYDSVKTEELKKDAKNSVQNVIIKKDQIIVKKGEPVTNQQIELLKDLGLLNNNSKINWNIYLSLSMFILMILSLQWYYLYKYRKPIYEQNSKLVLINLLTILSLILARTVNIISPYFIPLAFVPMLLTILIDYKVSLNISILTCILIGGVVSFNPEITILAVLNTILGTMLLRKMYQRNDIMYSSIYIAFFNVVLTFSAGFLLSSNIVEIAKRSAFSFGASIFSSILTIGFLPFFESTFDIVTTTKLLELSNPNNPLLKKLLLEAPGTYHHSILVSNLAELAAEEVGGNTVLTRVCAFYHDIGKIKRPYFFKENQMGNDNPHDKITPNLSTLIIISHVKDGVEMAKDYKLPKVIIDIIEQHHGTSLVKYFFLTVKNHSENPEDIVEESFRYEGPIPTTKEAGIIMLADAVEASVRSIIDPTQRKIEEMVNNIIKERLEDGQLDNCDLTLKDIDKIKKCFLKSLTGIYHKRIEYPNDKWENKR